MVSNTIDVLEVLMKQIATAKECSEMIERFRLEMVVKCLQTTSLQKRVRGLNDLNNLIKKTLGKKQYSMLGSEASSSWLESG